MHESEKLTRAQLKALRKTCKENAKENRAQAKDEDRDRAKYLEGGAEAFEYISDEISRILAGKTQVEALAERLAPFMSKKS